MYLHSPDSFNNTSLSHDYIPKKVLTTGMVEERSISKTGEGVRTL